MNVKISHKLMHFFKFVNFNLAHKCIYQKLCLAGKGLIKQGIPVRAKESIPMFVNESTDVFFPSEVATHSCSTQMKVVQGQLNNLCPRNRK